MYKYMEIRKISMTAKIELIQETNEHVLSGAHGGYIQ